MSDCLIHPNTPDKWIASMQDSLARILVSLESKPVLAKEPARGFTEKSCVLLGQLDPDSYSWKMSPLLKATVLNKLSKTWPSWGMTQGGFAYEHPMSGHRITETGGSRYAVPTPQARDWKGSSGRSLKGQEYDLPTFVKMWPTPNASCRDRGNMSMPSIQRRAAIGKQLNLSMVVHPTSGQLNPTWVEWLMGWPIGYTASKQSETVKSRSKSQSHLPSWLRSK
jgi:hypothetical protein